ncbi:MAG: hypothetical protein ACSHYF_06305 [Verrucomicrobiaceae bacterium]
MKTPFILLSLAFCLLASCGSVPSVSGLNKNDLRNFKLADLRGSKVPIVEVKKGSLKEMKTGQEKYLAWNRALKNKSYSAGGTNGAFFAPKDFNPGDLPTGAGMPSFGLLPPLNPGESSGLDISGGLEGLGGEKSTAPAPDKTD